MQSCTERQRESRNKSSSSTCQPDREHKRQMERERETMGSPVEIRNYDTFGQTDSTLKYVIRELEREREAERACSLNGI